MRRYFLFVAVGILFALQSAQAETSPSLKKNLLHLTMQSDIETSSYDELKTWADSLGLRTTGTRKELKQELYSYYKIQPDKKSIPENANTIVIKSADKLKNIKIKEMDEQYVVLTGGIHLEMSDKKNNTYHEIYADTLTFNQTEKTITATGSITYIIVKGNSKEYFYGDSLTFNVQSWEGMFFKGIAEKNKEINNNNVTFYFSGKKIYRKRGDKVILFDGKISSSRKKDPYYHLTAKKIWVLTPGEWAIQDPVLYVGRIPVFIFPFLFMPGDKLVFHPVYGVNDKKGYFINTTTYLLGQQKENPSSSLSFLQSSSQEGNTLIKRDGMFLQKTAIPLSPQKATLKLLADYYTRKGYFLGIDGTVQDSGFIKSFKIFAGIGFNRYIYDDPLYGYTPYLFDPFSDTYRSTWEHPYFLGVQLPFRFSLDAALTGEFPNGSIVLSLPFYSDSTFSSDFLDRKENFDFKSLFGNPDENTTVTTDTKDTLTWALSLKWHPNTALLHPFIQNITVDRFTLNVLMFSKEYQYDTEPIDPLKFYYPQNFSLPDFSASMNGTLFAFNAASSSEEKKEQKETGMLPPWATEKKKPSGQETETITPPDISEDIPLSTGYQYDGLAGSLSYSLFPRLTLSSVLNSLPPNLPQETRTVPDYSIFSFQNTAAFLYNFTVSDKLLELNTKLVFKTNYRNHFAESDSYTGDWSVFQEQDNQNTNYSIENGTTLTSYPFLWNRDFSKSFISYTINSTIYDYTYDSFSKSYADNFINWNTTDITSHQAVFSAVYEHGGNTQTAEVRVVLPPFNAEIYPSLKNTWGHFSSVVSTGFKQKSDSQQWDADPLSILGKYTFTQYGYISETLSLDYYKPEDFSTTEINLKTEDSPFTFKQLFKYDISNNKPVTSTTSLGLGIFSTSFSAENVNGYTFNPVSGWIMNPEEEFQPSKVSLGLHYGFTPDPFWENRIRFSSDIGSSWSMNLLKPTDTSFTFNLSFSLSIAEFLDLNFKSESVNRAFYRYIPGISSEVGIDTPENPFLDLLKSFNFFRRSDRLNSNFNLNLLDFTAVHHLGNWDLNIEYSGSPEIVTADDLSKKYEWVSSFSIFVAWKPIPEVKKEVSVSDNEINF